MHSAPYYDPMLPILFRAHAVQRMFERNISMGRVRQALKTVDVIEDYSPEMPEPGWLLFGSQGKRPFHVVVSQGGGHTTVVTVYLPFPDKWQKDSRNRR